MSLTLVEKRSSKMVLRAP